MIVAEKASKLRSDEVLAKREAGVRWSEHASAYAVQHGGKPWKHFIPHDLVAEKMRLEGMVKTYSHD
jgi:type III restriction enzyme